MKNVKICFCVVFLFYIAVMLFMISYATEVDKKGREIETILKPTAEKIIDSNEVEVAISSDKEPQKNIVSNTIIEPSKIDLTKEAIVDKPYTLIRKTVSIADVPEGRYEVEQDEKADRLRLKIKENGVGVWYAQNGFYKVNDKTYYFDEDGLMVLGLAKDPFDNYYYFSLDTGELLEEYTQKSS